MPRPPIDDRPRVEKLRDALPKMIEKARREGNTAEAERLERLVLKVAAALGTD